MVEYLPNTFEVLGSIPTVYKPEVTSHSSTGRQRQNDQKCEVILSYIVSLRLVWATRVSISKIYTHTYTKTYRIPIHFVFLFFAEIKLKYFHGLLKIS